MELKVGTMSPNSSNNKRSRCNGGTTSDSISRRGGKKRNVQECDISVDLDVLEIVMEYLAPRELFRLAFTCKYLRDCVTTQLVVQSALLEGGIPRETMQHLHKLIRYKRIFAPSCLRLLRLVNAKRCEHCSQVVVKTIRPEFGVAMCFRRCIEKGPFTEISHAGVFDNGQYTMLGGTFVLNTTPESQVLTCLPRAEMNRNRRFCWNAHYKAPGGELAGPILLLPQIEALGYLKDFEEVTITDQHVQQEYINCGQHPQDDATYQEFLDAFDTATLQIRQRDEAKAEIARLKKEQKAREREEKRLRAQQVAKENQARTENNHKNLVDKILQHLDKNRWRNIEGATALAQKLARDDYVNLCSAPKRAKINIWMEKLTLFLELSFLSHTNPGEAAVRRYCRTMPAFQSLASLVKFGSGMVLDKIKGGSTNFEAFLFLFGSDPEDAVVSLLVRACNMENRRRHMKEWIIKNCAEISDMRERVNHVHSQYCTKAVDAFPSTSSASVCCRRCGKTKDTTCFSKSQLKKKQLRRCMECVQSNR